MEAASNQPKSDFINHEAIVSNFSLRNGMTVADFGCGAGYFAIPMAKRLNNTGKVYAVDVLSAALEFIESQAKLFSLVNLQTVRANIEVLGSTKIPDKSVDLALIANVLFQCGNRDAALQEAKRILVPHGQIVIIDWVPENFFLGPKFNKCISEQESKKIAERNGLKVIRDIPVGILNYGYITEIK